MKIAIIDYGMGNIRSVENAFRSLTSDLQIVANPADLREAERIVLPGVGAFGDGMRQLHAGGWIPALEESVLGARKPFLGLCVGLQVLATVGTEHGAHSGLGWIPGRVERLRGGTGIRVPHIGWNDVDVNSGNGMYAGIERPVFYFVHSYAFQPEDWSVVSGTATHGEPFAASVESSNIWATQFHPEKSQRAGLQVLRNFITREPASFLSKSA